MVGGERHITTERQFGDMPQRTQTRDTDDDFADLLGDDSESAETSGAAAGSSESYRGRFKRRAAAFFAPRYFLLATVVLTVAMFVGSMFAPIGSTLGGLVAVFAASFLLGGLTSDSRILETAVGGAVASGLAFLVNSLVIAISVGGLNVAAVGAGAGFVVAALGAYFGGDLRDGITQDV
jgi:hypothetical protein